MSANSSISSSKSDSGSTRSRRYLTVFAASCVLSLVALVVVSLVTLRMGYIRWHFSQLYAYQIEKIRNFKRLDVLIVGDSSLGNAIDTAYWSKSLRANTASLALTGVYGYAGSLNMIRRTLRTTRPRLIVMVHTAHMLTREPSDKGLVLTAEGFSDVLETGLLTTVSSLASTDLLSHFLKSVLFGPLEVPPGLSEHDYWPQGKSLRTKSESMPEGTYEPASINPEKLKYLRRISDLCRKEGIPCIYAHGPLVESICNQSSEYIDEANLLISSTGMTVLEGTPVCIPWKEIGDSIDHVSPAYRVKFSRTYLELLFSSIDF